jgi:hypothetical protein
MERSCACMNLPVSLSFDMVNRRNRLANFTGIWYKESTRKLSDEFNFVPYWSVTLYETEVEL